MNISRLTTEEKQRFLNKISSDDEILLDYLNKLKETLISLPEKITYLLSLTKELMREKIFSWEKFIKNAYEIFFFLIKSNEENPHPSNFTIFVKFSISVLTIINQAYKTKNTELFYNRKENPLMEAILKKIKEMNSFPLKIAIANMNFISAKHERELLEEEILNFFKAKVNTQIDKIKCFNTHFYFTEFVQKNLEAISKHFRKDGYRVVKGIQKGIMKKEKLKYLLHPIIISDNMNFYLMLESLSESEFRSMRKNNLIPPEIISDLNIKKNKNDDLIQISFEEKSICLPLFDFNEEESGKVHVLDEISKKDFFSMLKNDSRFILKKKKIQKACVFVQLKKENIALSDANSIILGDEDYEELEKVLNVILKNEKNILSYFKFLNRIYGLEPCIYKVRLLIDLLYLLSLNEQFHWKKMMYVMKLIFNHVQEWNSFANSENLIDKFLCHSLQIVDSCYALKMKGINYEIKENFILENILNEITKMNLDNSMLEFVNLRNIRKKEKNITQYDEKKYHFLKNLLEIERAKLLEKNYSFQLTYIEQLLKHFVKDKYRVIKCIRLKKFSQKKLPYLSHSIIIGEDDGMYLLLKTVSKIELSYIEEKYRISSKYLAEKIEIRDKKNKKFAQDDEPMKISIGKGAFGKIEISICLLENRKKNIFPSQLLCVKKTKHEGSIINKKGETVTFSDIRDCTWNDYLSITNFTFSPEIYDMRIITHIKKNKLRKGYCFQKFIPVNNGSSFMKDKGFKKWKHQKKYFLDIIEALISFHENGICMTDLKPENTLYDLLRRKGTIIDLAGVVKKKNKEELKACKCKYIKESTPAYNSPEIRKSYEQDDQNDVEIDLPQAISFSVGKMIKKLVIDQMEATNSKETKILNSFIKLSENMTKDSPRERWTLEDSLKFIQEIPTFEKKKLFHEIASSYIEELKENFYGKKFRKNFGIKRKFKNILKGFYKDIEISKIDPEQAYSEKNYNLNALDVLREFILSESFPGEKELFLLMGAPGAGKSTILQFCFFDFLKKWKPKDALPIYMNLGEETNIYLQWKKIKKTLNIELSLHRINQEVNYPIILFLDCLDDSKRSLKLIKSIIDDLDGSKRSIKIVLTCKIGYFDVNKEQENLKFIKCNVQYLLPFSDDYLDNNDNIRELIISNLKKNKNEIINEELIHELVEKIERFEVKKMMKTPFLIDIVLKVLPNLKSSGNIDLLVLFEEYYNERFTLQGQNETQIKANLKFANELAESMMSTIHQTNKLDKEDSSDLIKSYFNSIYIPALPFFDQVEIVKIMKALDISIIVQNTVPNEEFHFSFPHDLIRKFFLVKGFLAKYKKNEFPKWMSHVSIVDDRDLIYLIILAVEKDRELIKFCQENLIIAGKEKYFSYLAPNLITILVAANISFYNENLSNINIKGANLTDGIFTRCDFTNTDLSNVIINNCKFEEAKFKNTNLKGAELDIYPKIMVEFVIYKIVLSSKEDKIFVCGESETIKIFNLKDHDIEVELKGHVNIVKTLVTARFSDILISGGCDQMIKIWEFNLKKEILTLFGHNSEITCLALSSKETELISGSKDNTIRVWNIAKGIEIFKIPTISSYIPNVFFHKNEKEIIFIDLKNIVLFNSETGIKHNLTHEEIILALAYDNLNDRIASAVHNLIYLWNINSHCFLKKLKGHEDAIQTLTFSKNFTFLISSGNDKNILIWDIQSGLIFNKLIGHTNVITSHQLSKNDDMIISGGFDKYLRIFSLNRKRKIKKYEGHKAEVTSLALTKDNLYLASVSLDQTIGIWHFWNGKEEKKIKVNDIIIRALCFLSPSRQLATGDEEGMINVWNIENGERLKKIDAHEDFINSLIASKNGQYLASGSSDNLVKIWLVQNDFEYLLQFNHDSIVKMISFSKNDSLIISSGEGEYIKIWDIASKNIINELPTDNSTINAISLSNDYTTLASGDSMDQLIIWNLENSNLFREPKMLPKYHKKQIFSILFLDDSTLISGGGDGMIYLWDLRNFNKIAEFIGHQSCIKSLIYCEEFDTIISGSEDKEIRIWDFNKEKKIEIQQYFSRIIIGSDATEFKGSKSIEEGREVEKRIARIFIDS